MLNQISPGYVRLGKDGYVYDKLDLVRTGYVKLIQVRLGCQVRGG